MVEDLFPVIPACLWPESIVYNQRQELGPGTSPGRPLEECRVDKCSMHNRHVLRPCRSEDHTGTKTDAALGVAKLMCIMESLLR